ncbi:hypothetical protein PoB_001351700 [Plakobranchus ocellatus]|uniref:Ig-like domain-containing protein n=1 Tax=Plakobranchus ocellatus TaxID=259542 RepID=A0AAV3YXE1_9GAST|nr:hypothetical protein PoB_001351700 [Plakobranchus ocellatus]
MCLGWVEEIWLPQASTGHYRPLQVVTAHHRPLQATTGRAKMISRNIKRGDQADWTCPSRGESSGHSGVLSYIGQCTQREGGEGGGGAGEAALACMSHCLTCLTSPSSGQLYWSLAGTTRPALSDMPRITT